MISAAIDHVQSSNIQFFWNQDAKSHGLEPIGKFPPYEAIQQDMVFVDTG